MIICLTWSDSIKEGLIPLPVELSVTMLDHRPAVVDIIVVELSAFFAVVPNIFCIRVLHLLVEHFTLASCGLKIQRSTLENLNRGDGELWDLILSAEWNSDAFDRRDVTCRGNAKSRLDVDSSWS